MIGRILGNRYEIIEKIGGGGMSDVYKARCKVLNRFVAIKVLKQELTQDPDFVEKFKQESLSAASLTHPNIVNIYDTGIEDDIYYIVMEYVHGITLKKYIQKKGRLSEQETIRISRQIADALRHAHANKIVHRDIKPHNIMLTDEGIVKVADFGIARAASSSTINNTSNVIGSVHYFSPEQARGGYVDEKSDIYSLGVVMYEMITGVVPFDADNHISVAMKQIQEKAVPPSKRLPDIEISKDLEEIIMKCLEKHQSFRYKNIEEMLNKLNVLAGYTPITKEEKEEFLDSPTIVIPKISDGMMKKDDEKKIIELNLIDEKSDKAFKTFFGEDNIDDSIGKQNPKKKSEMNKKLDEEKRRNRKITAAAIICALAVAMLGGFIGLKAMLYVPEVKVPDLIGKNEDAAKKIVEDLGLVFKVSEREYSSKYDDGEVIEQSVEKDTKLKKGYPVDVVVSKGIQDIKVPNLVGKFAIEAGIILSDYGLKEGTVTEEFSDTVPAGQIISQNPAKNTPADVGDKVDYAVSKGSEKSTVVMPNLVGLQLDTAKKLIEENGLAVGQVTEEKSEKAAGIVTKQSVPAGQDVAAGSAIWMTISSGSEEPEQKPETGTGEIKPTDGTYPLTITLPKDKDKVLVVVQRVIDDKREIIYSKEVETSQQNITVNIQGEGYQTFEIYIDNKLYDRAEINF